MKKVFLFIFLVMLLSGCIKKEIVIKYKCPVFETYSQQEIIDVAKEMNRLKIDDKNAIWLFIDKSYLNYSVCKELEKNDI